MTVLTPDEITKVAVAFVRGEMPWKALQNLGVEIQVEPEKVQVDVPPGMPVVEVSARDVATGFLRHWASGANLREWAAVLLATGFIDFADLEDQPGGDSLLDALWAASTRDPISDETVASARILAENPPPSSPSNV